MNLAMCYRAMNVHANMTAYYKERLLYALIVEQ